MSARAGRGLIGPTVFALAGIAVLIGLGVWQLERKAWKESLIATLTARLSQAPPDLPPRAGWARLPQADTNSAASPLPRNFSPARRRWSTPAAPPSAPTCRARLLGVRAGAAGRRLNRRRQPRLRPGRRQGCGEQTAAAARHRRDRRRAALAGNAGLFTPADEPQHNVWFLRDPDAMAKAHKWQAVAPFYVEQEAPVPAGGVPKPGKLTVNLPNDHLQYAITWFGLACALAGVYVVFIARRLAGRGRDVI